MSPVEMPSEEFEALVGDALDALPEWTVPFLEQIAVLVRDEPEPGATRPGVTLLGQYRGIPATVRGGRVPGTLPDTITVFRLPILAACRTADDVPGKVLKVVGHEVGHAMGLSERELRALGWY